MSPWLRAGVALVLDILTDGKGMVPETLAVDTLDVCKNFMNRSRE